MHKVRFWGKILAIGLVVIILAGFAFPQNLLMPVEGATRHDFDHQSFWAHPWGKAITHKGVDIVAEEGRNVRAATSGLVIWTAKGSGAGGTVVLILGPKWRLHYYAHMRDKTVNSWRFVRRGDLIGFVGRTGLGVDIPPHLHYGIGTIIPYPWRWDDAPVGWRKIIYLNPIPELLANS